MPAAKFTPFDDPTERHEDEFRGGRRDWRRWWDDKAEALDPEKWKAMASAWWCMLQDAAREAQSEQAEHGPGSGDQDLSLLRRRNQSRGDQVQALRHLAGPRPGGGPIRRNRRFRAVPPTSSVKGYAPPRLTRSATDATAAGVLSGLARFFGVDPTWLRVAYALGTIFTGIIPGIAVYAILALIIPGER